MLFLLLGLAFQVAAPAPPDPAMYLDFFRNAARQVDAPRESTLNGLSPTVVLPSFSDALSITHEEAAIVLRIAPLCVHEVDQLDVDSRAVVFEARLQAAEDGKVSDAVAAKLKELESLRTSVVLNYVQQLKASLDPDTVRRVDDYVRAGRYVK